MLVQERMVGCDTGEHVETRVQTGVETWQAVVEQVEWGRWEW